VLSELHDALDREVFAAYGWSDLAERLVGRPGATTPLLDKPEEQTEAEEELLCRLVALNAERTAEEARGLVRWLRPDYQCPDSPAPQQIEAELDSAQPSITAEAVTGKQAWPKTMREQVAAVRTALALGPMSLDAIAGRFKRRPTGPISGVLEALEALGMVETDGDLYRMTG
jgi:hypothetical protein